MGSALARGILSKRILPFNHIYASDKDAAKTKALYKKFGVHIDSKEEVVKKSNFVIIAVKPQDAKKVLPSISGELDNKTHLISIMAGISISRIEKLIKKKIAVTRAMPNIAALVGKSITCLCHNKMVREKLIVQKIFSAIGEVIEVEEKHMDIVTAISGSGPAYFFYLAEILRDAAVKLGIKKDKAAQLAVATLVGSGALLDSREHTVEELRSRITSKRGTTEAALNILKKKEFKNLIIEAARAATKRSKEISKGV